MRAKELTKLELAQSQIFSDLDESKKATKPTLDLSRVIFHSMDKSQIALVLSRRYSTPGERHTTNLAPMLANTHKDTKTIVQPVEGT
jgi:hypothetical protein